jgi:hypothetical protein
MFSTRHHRRSALLVRPMQALRIAANAATDWQVWVLAVLKTRRRPTAVEQTLAQIAISCNQLRHTQIAVMNKLVSLQ